MEFYNNAARAIDQLDAKQGSLKSIVFTLAASKPQRSRNQPPTRNSEDLSSRRISDGRRLLRVVAETLRYRQVIEAILRRVDILNLESKVLAPSRSPIQNGNRSKGLLPRAESLLLVLVHDHLFSSRGISLAKIHKIRLAIERHSSQLKSELSRLLVRNGVSQVNELIDLLKGNQSQSGSHEDLTATDVSKVRWLRVNTIKWSLAEAIGWFKETGWNQVPFDTFITQPSDLTFAEDEHVAHLLVFPSSLNLVKLAPYLDGRLIAQDKASCIPAQLLLGDRMGKGENIQVIDATAAPGNKTTMLSAIVGSKGKVWAFERDKQRFRVLQQMVRKAGCTNVKCIHGDFLSIDPSDVRFEKLSHIMVDPSCSGSGIGNRLDHLSHTDSKNRDDDRINSLSKFQTTIVSHALRFPSVNQVVYSTCSIWKEENEQVVLSILKKPEMVIKGWTLKDVKKTFLINQKKPWIRTGEVISKEEKYLTDRMVRFDPKVDQTIGFFAAVFLRTSTMTEKPDKILKSYIDHHHHHNQSVSARQRRHPTHRSKQLTWKGIRPGRLIQI